MKGLLAANAAWQIHNEPTCQSLHQATCQSLHQAPEVGRLSQTHILQAPEVERLSQTHSETHLSNLVTVYKNQASVSAISNVIDEFQTLWQDRKQHVKIPESEQMEIPLIDNWEEIYKPGQARVYPVERRDKEIIDNIFDKLHKQGRIK